MKQPALIIIKPDGISKRLVGDVFTKFARARLVCLFLQTLYRIFFFYRRVHRDSAGEQHQEKQAYDGCSTTEDHCDASPTVVAERS